MHATETPTMPDETRQLLSSQLRMASADLLNTPAAENFNLLSRAIAAVSRAGVSNTAVQLGCCALYDIYARYETTAAITVTDGEAERIRAAIDSIDAALPSVEVKVLKQAISEIDVNCASVGA